MLAEAAAPGGVEPVIAEGDGAFYAPKLDFIVQDAIGREWTCGTLQLDYVLPERLDAEYVGEDGSKHRPVMLHRAILGSFERFIGILLENYAGALPLWLAPGAGRGGHHHVRRRRLRATCGERLTSAGIRAELDVRNEKINYKIREHSLAKVPVIAVVGRKEAENGEVALRRLGGEGQQVLSLEDAVRALTEDATPPDLARDRSAAAPAELAQA
jgi:threonyl-tRNA synthetase